MRHRNETFGWHVCAGRAKHVVDLDPTVARTYRSSRRRRRQGCRRPRRNHDQTLTSVSRRCVKTLRGQERPVDCGDTRRRFRRRGLARAPAAPHERIGSAGRYGRADARPDEETARGGLRRRERSAYDENCQISLRTACSRRSYYGYIYTAVLVPGARYVLSLSRNL